MRKVLPFLFILFVLACMVGTFRHCKPLRDNAIKEKDTVVVIHRDTIHHTDTVTKYYPKPQIVRVTDTLYVRDTVLVREQKTYSDSLYTAWVSGYDARLDSINIYPKTTIITNDVSHSVFVPPKRKPFGLGLQVGCGYPRGVYFGIGISYNIISF